MVTKRSSTVREMDSQYIEKREQELEFQAKKRRGLIRRLSVLGIFGFILAGIASVTFYAQASTINEKQEEKQALEQELELLKAEEKRLEQEIINYNDLDYIAEIARRDYYLSKPGETLFKLPDSSAD
ncbi:MULTISPECIES: FtsB family cell division protein [Alkalihalophilus]|uniref:Cell-division initiation protein (Septum formation) DivIC n=3 Tax=Alkalihalophilus TaxID=2893060 RepID=D3FR18_ALKPO|nr:MULTISPECIES: septum formation initiator family protein [Alkalihalophilus]ADC49714.1 cell-division initiation protein (septum formation) DivIC [Alkalihalophilus pseudofirmus OF4]ERN53538.1 cell division protein [Alkalihalophilus marmarensis DSM 21297]MCM3491488.1 septum formation initiator family protein [Alkalihalophilus marmarensis]MDV2887300.1 septum formation initiator family protein [Alkalihalophilus pseudofirmus]MEC2073571.1 septum formation initiator family protein [Alkalihalophilus 